MLTPPFRDVLIVDDNPVMLHLLDRVLSAAGYSVRRASGGHEALALMEEHCSDFVITDWSMPEMDGLELCRRIRGTSWHHYVFIAVLTSADSTENLISALDAGADDFYIKPVVAPELLARLRAGSRFLELERRLRSQAQYDPLTNVLNRRCFHEIFLREWNYSQRHDSSLACVMVDIDYFKTINDRFGHPAGDEVLRLVARTIQENTRAEDYVSRFGGEEFCVLLPSTTEDGAAHFAERCRIQIVNTSFPTSEGATHLTASFGVAERGPDCFRPEDLIDHADQALLWAKQNGRNIVFTNTQSREERSMSATGLFSTEEASRIARELASLSVKD